MTSLAIVASAKRPIRIPFVPGTRRSCKKGGAKIQCEWRVRRSACATPQEMSNQGYPNGRAEDQAHRFQRR